MPQSRRRNGLILASLGATGLVAWTGHVSLADPPAGGQVQLETTTEDFFQPGTQPLEAPPGTKFAPIVSSEGCYFCHGDYLDQSFVEPFDAWAASMMAQSARDPVWRAALTIANQDAADSGEYCIRCHAPGAWLGGRSLPSDGSAFISDFEINDFEGVTCHFCHRTLDPVLSKTSPPEDADILADLAHPPGDGFGNGRYVVDPEDVRRGPFDDVPFNYHGVPIIPSAFHRESEQCGACHDVANPVYTSDGKGGYVLTGMDQAHPTQDPYDMFPEQRTYSEWLHSAFAQGGVLFDDQRFGGNHPTGVMESCQDCHMPDEFAGGCFAWDQPPFFPRPDMPLHGFAGANKWVLNAIRALYTDDVTRLSDESVKAANARTDDMLRAASDVQLVQLGDALKVRVINWSGHKLPTGYPEGRRMWLNVTFLDAMDGIIAERGAYDFDTGLLVEADTKVYRASIGMSPEVASMVNLPAGPTLHLVLADEIAHDNRIPPIGFENAAYQSFGGQPMGATYADGQHWDDTSFDIPAGAARAVVTLYYQTMTREYVEFLRDHNVTDDAGDTLFALWDDPLIGAKAPPVDLDSVAIDLGPPRPGDTNSDGVVDFLDLLEVLGQWGPCPGPDLCTGDVDCDGAIGLGDLLLVLSEWG
jgi:hypothetical protein